MGIFAGVISLIAVTALVTAPVSTAPPQSTSAASTPAALTTGSPPGAAAFGEPPFFSSPSLSPSGRRIVAMGTAGGKPVLMLIEISGDSFKSELLVLGDHIAPNWIRWAGDDRLLIGTPGLGYFFSGIATYDIPARKFAKLDTPLLGVVADNVIHVSADGSFALMDGISRVNYESFVWRVDLATGSFTRLLGPYDNINDYYADDEGVVRAGIGVSGKTYHSIYRDIDGRYKRAKRVKVDLDDEESAIDAIIPRPGSMQAYAIANPGTGRFALYDYDLRTGDLGTQIFAHPEVDIEGIRRQRGGAVLGVDYTDDRARVHWIDPALAALQNQIDKSFPNRVNSIVSIADNGARLLIWSSAPEDPGAYYLYTPEKRRFVELARPYDKLEGARLARTEPVRYTARDGLEIPAYLTLPPNRDPRGLPLVMFPHGGPFARDSWGYDPFVQFLASRGYAVLQPNFRGSTGYGRAFVKAGEGEWGRKMQDDIDDGARWLAARGIVDARRACIMGISFGGYAAMWASIRNPDLYRCAISVAGISDVKQMLRYDRSTGIARRYYRDWRDRVRGDAKFDLDRISPIRFADRAAMPILIAHGGKDTNVPPDQSEDFHAALRKAGKDSELVLYPDSLHGTTNGADTSDFLARVERFLARHNPATTATKN